MIYSYFDPIGNRDPEDELRLMLLWREHHRKLGIETAILCEYHASGHPDYAGYLAAIEALTQKPGDTEEWRPSFLRWLAMARVARTDRCVMMAYNTFLYPMVWDDLNPLFHINGTDKLRIYQGSRPSLVVGDEKAYQRQASLFANCKLTGAAPGVTDVQILEAQALKVPESLDCFQYVKDYGSPGWDTAFAVRYPRQALERDNWPSRWRAIPDLRPRYTPPSS